MDVKTKKGTANSGDLLRDLLIVQLGMAKLTRHQIREVVGVDMNRVTRIMKYFPKPKERSGGENVR